MRPRRCEDNPDMVWMRDSDVYLWVTSLKGSGADGLTAETAGLVPVAGKRSLAAFVLAASALVALPLSLLVRRRRSIAIQPGSMAAAGGGMPTSTAAHPGSMEAADGGLPTSVGKAAPQTPSVATATSSSREMI